MRALQVQTLSSPPILCDLPLPTPRGTELRIAVKACALNFADTLMVSGRYQDTPQVPFVLGLEVAGVIDAVGPDVAGFAPGMRVMAYCGSGGLAQFLCVESARVIEIPDSLGFNAAAALQVAYGTSHMALTHKGHLQAGERLVVTGAAGGVGLTAVEIGKQLGAEVIAIARGADKLAIAKSAGADHLIDAQSDDIRAQVLALGGADVVYDAVGSPLFEPLFRATNPDGRILVIGFAGGTVPQVKLNHMLVKNITLSGFYFGAYATFAPEPMRRTLGALAAWVAEGKLHPHISHVLPLERAQEGLDLLRDRGATGKVVIEI
ncbi:Phthiocerol synthesis polyketide synthase type I PpsC [Aquimixticola soesokkakensis]|uniref:Phthiocerol synthesis polyketide synthase type I PpsC n=1 Tax=Aquimixticola soesokkakensis TaxID=1519096 RepID=A0A1Y5TBU3_9RHOB|nr:NADPH:quinone oxidoreductase family protein [Aquimixticola soesokkakensis]SLN58468.1 Phthiocerol synthesis polyketide synthase type I PpsC [Aquimixticola soesokkakensis]